jgi:phosphate transport system protein
LGKICPPTTKKAAHHLWKEDDVADVRYHLVRHDLMTMMAGTHTISALQRDSHILQRATYLFWIAHKLERVGDHCGNICERIVFIVKGQPFCISGTDAQRLHGIIEDMSCLELT